MLQPYRLASRLGLTQIKQRPLLAATVRKSIGTGPSVPAA
jgi:hypothetical protein